MSLSKYVSAEWVTPTFSGEPPMIKAIGDDGNEYWIPGDNPEVYDVPPWGEFVASAAGQDFLKSAQQETKPADG